MNVTLTEAFCMTEGRSTRTPATVTVPGPVTRRSDGDLVADAFAGRLDAEAMLTVFEHFGHPCASRGRLVTDAAGTTWFCAAQAWMDAPPFETGFEEEPHGQVVQT